MKKNICNFTLIVVCFDLYALVDIGNIYIIVKLKNSLNFWICYMLDYLLKSQYTTWYVYSRNRGEQWLSGRELDSRPRGCGFERTGVTALWSLSKTHLSKLSTGSTQEDPSLFNLKIVEGT